MDNQNYHGYKELKSPIDDEILFIKISQKCMERRKKF